MIVRYRVDARGRARRVARAVVARPAGVAYRPVVVGTPWERQDAVRALFGGAR